MNNFIDKFCFARSALKYGLNLLDLSPGDKVLVPGYICDVVNHSFNELGLKIINYSILDDFNPDWNDINKSVKSHKIKGILMAHYFGQPQKIDLFKSLCQEHGLYLIEDNAHGHGGFYNGHFLGTYGDIGISSPRKILSLPYGGILFYNKKNKSNNHHSIGLKYKKYGFLNQNLKHTLNNFPKLKGKLKSLSSTGQWSDPYNGKEDRKLDYEIDKYSLRLLKKASWEKIANKKRQLWKEWNSFCLKNNLDPVFKKIHHESCPWVFQLIQKI